MSHTALPVRRDDPDTSYEAAARAAIGASKVRPVVLELIKEHGPLTHDELIAHYHSKVVMEPDTPRASESGIRTRLRELVSKGLVVQADTEGFSNFGNSAKRWMALPEDDPSFDPNHDLALACYFQDEDIVGFFQSDADEDED